MTESALLFNPLDPALSIDPYPHYARLRETEPIHVSPLGYTLLMRQVDIAEALASPSCEHQYALTQMMRAGEGVVDEPYFKIFQLMVFVLDNPGHVRVRKLFTAWFTPRRVAAMRPTVEAIANGLLDKVQAEGSMDLIADFALPFPMQVIGDLLGIPTADHARIGELAHALNPVLQFLPMDESTLAAANAAVVKLAEYFRELADAKRETPDESLFASMVQAAAEESISDEELIANAILMYVAGHETTAGATGLAILALHRNPEQLALLAGDRSLLRGAVNELLRYDAPGQATARVTIAPLQLADAVIPAGTGIVAYLGAANRDPAAFSDPDRLDITRLNDGAMMTFGRGAHFCLGNALALQELEVALDTLLTRFPGMKLATLDPEFRTTALMRGLQSLTVSW